MAEYPYPDPIVQVTDVQDLARDLAIFPWFPPHDTDVSGTPVDHGDRTPRRPAPAGSGPRP
ncbi:MAG TPA: hypothetical protein VJ305_10520 [Streptosporangiaceae bacterium]|jgi:hypothetical protein|nr:hypothetical protein [Streptosporangiaceae bacterium]